MYSMKIEQPNCPECGQPAAFVSEIQPVFAEICMTGEDRAEYTGTIEKCPGQRTPELDQFGKSCVCCRDDHFWQTYIR